MKSLHRSDLFAWSSFDQSRNVDFNGTYWQRKEGGILFDPMPPSEHDIAHIESLGGASWILLTNADHVRAAAELAAHFGASIAAPAAERDNPAYASLDVKKWFAADEILGCGIRPLPMAGSKTSGEVAFLLPGGDTLVTGDLIRGQHAGRLNILPDAKLSDRAAALAAVSSLLDLPHLSSVLVGDGQSIFRDARARLSELAAELGGTGANP